MVKDPAAVARFNREAANAARIEHDRVARVFDFGETEDGLVYLAMEFVPGRTLGSILEETPTLSPIRVANLIFQVAEGLDAAHRMSIIHRDLKPDNIMVVTDESGIDRAKGVDFGIAKAVDETPGQRTQLTQAGTAIGTPQFMSPEQVFGEQLDARSDVYALALVAYQLLTGELPFDSSTPERSLTARIVSNPRTLADAAASTAWPAALQEAFDRALLELGVNTLIVLGLVIAIYLARASTASDRGSAAARD
jgi:serine/threonine-protein kinase